jgi:diguanylate cyclase (GGDEF)-like protein/PAS domain S-box-containing protein
VTTGRRREDPAPAEDVGVLRGQIEDLRSALAAIRGGGVDAVLISGPEGDQVYTLTSADRPYRVLVEGMGEGAATISARGIVLYANQRLADMLGCDRAGLLGRDVGDLLHRDDTAVIGALLTVAPGETARAELRLRCTDGPSVPALVSVTGLDMEDVVVRCLVASDLTDHRRAEQRLLDAYSALSRSTAELHEAQRVARVGSWLWDRAGDGVDWSDVMYAIYALDRGPEPLTFGGALAARSHPDDLARVVAARDRAVLGREPFEVSHRLLLPGGATRHVLTRGEVVVDVAGAASGMRGTTQDITQLTDAQHAVAVSSAQFAAAFEHGPVGMALVSLDGTLLRVNDALVHMLGYPADTLVGRSLEEMTDPRDRRGEWLAVVDLAAGNGHGHGHQHEVRLLDRNGEPIWTVISTALVPGADGEPSYFVMHVEDARERKRYEGRLQFLADHDPLTGLYNRRRFDHELERHLAQEARYGGRGAVLMIDLDNLKYVNDTLGHSAGDAIIRTVASVLRDRCRESDVLARLGGDEFAVLLPSGDTAQGAQVARALLDAVRAEGVVVQQRHRTWVTASIGVSPLVDGVTRTAEEVLATADLAMYAAKSEGRDRVAVYDADGPYAAHVTSTFRWLDRIRGALENDLFDLEAQPILDLARGVVTHYELLLRMRDDDRLLPPAPFLYIAEKHGLAPAIDRWVIAAACRIAATAPWNAYRLEVNLSADSLGAPDLTAFIARQLADNGVDPRMLVFEVTETAAIGNMETARRFVEELSELGCGFALDDFGAGFGSFYYLKYLPFDYLKIDGEFIRSLPTSETDRHILSSIVTAARGMGKKTVAEYVGDAETVELLLQYGVDYAQGYFIGEPQRIDGHGLMLPVQRAVEGAEASRRRPGNRDGDGVAPRC